MSPPTNSSSIDYRQSLLKIISSLKYLQDLSQELNLTNLVEIISESLKRIENNSFKIVVLGDFNRGKSTFINALLGQEILPSDILATTATPSRIIYSLTPAAKVAFKDGSEQEIEILELSNYVTKLTSKSEATAAKIKEAIVYYPIPYCQNNVEIIDTPGLSDDEEMTAVTYTMINQCDLVIMVISAQSPFSISEGEFFTNTLLENGINHVLFVVNRIDAFPSHEDAIKVISLIKNRIKKCIKDWSVQQLNSPDNLRKIGNFKIFGISAFEALQAKQSHNQQLLAKSLFVNFEYALKTLINQQRGLIQLEITNNRIINWSQEILKIILEQESMLKQKQLKFNVSSKSINNEIILLIRLLSEIMQSINVTLTGIKQQITTSYFQLENNLKQISKQIIESSILNINEEKNLAERVSNYLQTATIELANKIQSETKQALSTEWLRVKDFIDLFEKDIPQLNNEISHLGLSATINKKAIDNIRYKLNKSLEIFNQKQLINLSLSFSSKSEIFVFTKEASGIATTTGATIGLSLLGPLGGVIGGYIGAAVGDNMRNEKFKENYLPQVIAEIDNQLRLMNVNQTVNSYVYQACSGLEEVQILLMKEVKPILDNIQNQMVENYAKIGTKIMVEQQEISHNKEKVNQVLDDAKKLSEKFCLLRV
jgi:GTPase Era involved in 16S rRNA processing/polyhydroxyalkanoate synthesis regulator phasin